MQISKQVKNNVAIFLIGMAFSLLVIFLNTLTNSPLERHIDALLGVCIILGALGLMIAISGGRREKNIFMVSSALLLIVANYGLVYASDSDFTLSLVTASILYIAVAVNFVLHLFWPDTLQPKIYDF